MHCVLETPGFARQAKAEGLTEDDRLRINTTISQNPKAGELIQGTGGARKLRFPKDGSGKSSGYRVITYYAADDVPVFLLALYSKGVKINISQAERNELKTVLAGVADDYRAAVKEKVSVLKDMAS